MYKYILYLYAFMYEVSLDFLKRCFNNINCQTIKANNLIFIDDGNKDENLKSTVSYLLDDSINLI